MSFFRYFSPPTGERFRELGGGVYNEHDNYNGFNLYGGGQTNSDPRFGFQPYQYYDLPNRGYREELGRGHGGGYNQGFGRGEYRHDRFMDLSLMNGRYMGGKDPRGRYGGRNFDNFNSFGR